MSPDLTILGKIIGGGLPGRGATAGAAELMERIAPAGDVYQAGTLSGNPLAVAAGLATLDPARRRRLRAARPHHRAARRRACARPRASAGAPVQVQSVTGLVTVFFAERPVRNYADAAACDLDAYGAWCRALLERGVYPPASQFEAWFPSLAHGEAELERTLRPRRRPSRRSR